MADGSKKPIHEVQVGEFVLTSNGSRKVTKAKAYNIDGSIYAFNGDRKYFVTANHAFQTTDGWKAIDPETATKETGLPVKQLRLGDVLIREGGETVVLERIDAKDVEMTVYNIVVEDMHEFYADGCLVHNALYYKN